MSTRPKKKPDAATLTPAPDAPPPPAGDAGAALFRDRVRRITRVPASALLVNPRNWREHPEYQTNSLTAVLERIGFVGAVLVRETGAPGDDTKLELLDGHLRRELMGAQEVTALVTDLTEAEALEVLATYDQLTTLALPNQEKLKDLLGELKAADVPLLTVGWPEYKLEQVLAEKWIPPAGSATATLAAAAAAPGPDAAPGGETATEGPQGAENDPGAGFKNFAVPLTVAQELKVREAIKSAKQRFGLESSGDALARIVAEWVAAVTVVA